MLIHFLSATAFRMKESVPTIVMYSRAELMPPKPSEFGEVKQGIKNIVSSYRSGAWKNVTVKVSNLNLVDFYLILCFSY